MDSDRSQDLQAAAGTNDHCLARIYRGRHASELRDDVDKAISHRDKQVAEQGPSAFHLPSE